MKKCAPQQNCEGVVNTVPPFSKHIRPLRTLSRGADSILRLYNNAKIEMNNYGLNWMLMVKFYVHQIIIKTWLLLNDLQDKQMLHVGKTML